MGIAGQLAIEDRSQSIPATMLAAVYRGVNDVRLETVPVTQMGAGELLLRGHTCGVCGSRDLVEEKVEGTGELVNYTVVYYPPRDFLGQEPYVVGPIAPDEGVLVPAPVVGIAPDDVEVGSRVRSTLRRMKLGHEGDIYYSQKFVLDHDPPKRRRSRAQAARKEPAKAAATRRASPRPRRGSAP